MVLTQLHPTLGAPDVPGSPVYLSGHADDVAARGGR